MNKLVLFSSIVSIFVLFVFSASPVLAHPHVGQVLINNHSHEAHTEITSLGGNIALEKSTIFFHVPDDNSLPWGFVEGKIANHVEGFPVIIQIFDSKDAVHFAQTEVADDGSYEYKFRVLNSENHSTTKIFNGDYTVKIFKVVYLNLENSI